jgi:RNA polymerase sigma-70 factor (ECF subfamily)
MDMDPVSPHLRFTRLWMQAQPVVVSVLTAQLRDHAAVEDVMQEVALAAYQALDGYDEARSFTGWAVGIAQHKAVDWLRRNGPRRLVIQDEQALATLAQVAAELEGEFTARELALHGCLEVLAGRPRDLVRLHYAEDKPLAEIATALGLSLANVKVMLHRVREALRACVERRLSAEGR